MNEIEETTLAAAQRGSQKAFRKLYDYYAPLVWRLCYRASNGEKRIAEEIMQDVFIKVHRSLNSFRGNSAFSTWLFRVTYNATMEYHSKITRWNRFNKPLEEDLVGEQRQDTLEAQQQIQLILEPLSSEERFLLTAREVEGLTYDELAVIIGESEGALRTKVSRLKTSIKNRLQKNNGEVVINDTNR
ncbi:sigma-70 family RNA polymerase sigma factor [Chitinispirillales bacterium ANBcel5]|uniref:RNA polymerase sigma factor n=1 Tax=Cellulosispirillum alkaliphilum TaxID=3039283 RepID=UPI002A561CD5|nr:sigma-70 family RNA polymerase sigma factor [Chitinispirillales bacterium ANBcel5]